VRIAIAGAGPSGAYAAGVLAHLGHEVTLYDRRLETQTVDSHARTIQLSLSPRGYNTLAAIGVDEQFKRASVSLQGRVFHLDNGTVQEFGYPEPGWQNWSISREALADIILSWAQQQPALQVELGVRCIDVKREPYRLILEREGVTDLAASSDLVVGADGFASGVRSALVRNPSVDFGKRFSPWGYLEVSFRASLSDSRFSMPAIHIWPRESWFMVAFPSVDGIWRGTVIFNHDQWRSCRSAGTLENLLHSRLNDFEPLVPWPDLVTRDLSPIVIVRLGTITDEKGLVLIGDAAHATAPFMGQGVNIALEDAAALGQAAAEFSGDIPSICAALQEARSAEGIACADLSERAASMLTSPPQANANSRETPLALLNFQGFSYSEVASRYIRGWEPSVYFKPAVTSVTLDAELPAELIQAQDLSAGAVLFNQGDKGQSLYVIREGVVRISNEELGVVRLPAPTIVGEMAWFGESERIANAVMETDGRAESISFADIDAWTVREPARAIGFVRELAELAVGRLKGLFHSVPGYLLLLSDGQNTAMVRNVVMSHREGLAAMAIIADRTTARILNEEAGIVPVRELDPASLQVTVLIEFLLDQGDIRACILLMSSSSVRGHLEDLVNRRQVPLSIGEEAAATLITTFLQ
jgi:kynurenine 3-monooxygenase